MNESTAKEFLNKLEALCGSYGIWCDMSIKKRPRLEHADVKISVKVDRPQGVDNIKKAVL